MLEIWLRCLFNGVHRIRLQWFSVEICEYKPGYISHDLLKIECSHWLKLQHSDWRANLVKDFFEKTFFPPMRALEFIIGHVIFELCYDQIYQMKNTLQ